MAAPLERQIGAAFKSEDHEFRHAYVDSFLHSRIALQIRSNRRARGWTQKQLAARAGMHQSQIVTLEKITNTSWKISTLQRVAAAMDLVLIVKFESFGSALQDFSSLAPEKLVRLSFDEDPAFKEERSAGAFERATVAGEIVDVWQLPPEGSESTLAQLSSNLFMLSGSLYGRPERSESPLVRLFHGAFLGSATTAEDTADAST